MDNEIFDTKKVPKKSTLKRLSALCSKLVNAEEDLQYAEQKVSEIKAYIKNLKMNEIPNIMSAEQISKVAYGDWEIGVENVLSGSWPKTKTGINEAVEYLEKCDATGIISTQVVVDLPREEYELAQEIVEQIKDRCDPTIKEFVNHNSLKKFARERMENGEAVDLSKLNLSMIQMAKVK